MTETLESAYRQHADELMRYATVTVGPEEALGVVTDAMVRVFADRPHDGGIGNLRAYLFRAVHNQIVDVVRSESQRRRREVRWQADRPVSEVRDEVAFLARNILGELSEQQRAVVFLTYWCDLTPTNVADTLHVRGGTVRKQLARARARLKDLIDV